MAEMLTSSLLWRVLLAIGGWFSALAHSSKVVSGIGRAWRASRTRAWFVRRLASSDAPTRESRAAKRFARLNARLAARHGLKDCLEDSLLCRIWHFFVRCGKHSRLFSWLFSDGLHGVILFALSMYVVIDYVLRDLLAVPVLSSCWDECLMLLALGYAFYERLGRKTPLKTGCNPLDLPVCLFIAVCFVLMNVVTPYYSIQISGFRATVQYMLWFFLVTRLVHDDRDFLRVYLALVVLAAVIALHGIYQYIVAVPIPSSWMTHTETSVRTRVYSIFGSPNIMGDFMTMFAPMAAGLAYYTKNRKLQVLAWICAFCMCFGCLFTMSRGAWMALALAIVIFVVLVDRRLLVLLLAVSLLGPQNALSIALLIGVTGWFALARIVRGEVRQIRHSEYILASRCMGGSFGWIMRRHLVPNVVSAILFVVISAISTSIAMESTLSFLGLGLPVDELSWGSMLALADKALLLNTWWVILIPGLFLVTALLCITSLGHHFRRNSVRGPSNL